MNIFINGLSPELKSHVVLNQPKHLRGPKIFSAINRSAVQSILGNNHVTISQFKSELIANFKKFLKTKHAHNDQAKDIFPPIIVIMGLPKVVTSQPQTDSQSVIIASG